MVYTLIEHRNEKPDAETQFSEEKERYTTLVCETDDGYALLREASVNVVSPLTRVEGHPEAVADRRGWTQLHL
jgi:hypothetical protein